MKSKGDYDYFCNDNHVVGMFNNFIQPFIYEWKFLDTIYFSVPEFSQRQYDPGFKYNQQKIDDDQNQTIRSNWLYQIFYYQ